MHHRNKTNKDMDRKEFESFLPTYKKIKSIAEEIAKYAGGGSCWLEKWNICGEYVIICYAYACYGETEYDYIEIPIDNLLNGTWKEYLKEEEEKQRRELEEREKQRIEQEKDKRKKLYEELKKEFE